MWSEQLFDNRLRTKLSSLEQSASATLLADYLSARRFVTEEIAPYISRTEPDLTDHSGDHLADVMKTVCALIGPDDLLTAYEFYLLGISILFHDVGNLHGRQEHNKKIADIYNAARHNEPRFKTERNAVLAIAGAHTGTTSSGDTDTVKSITSLSFQGNRVRGRELAAILRLGDELAEGPHRTSAYLLNHQQYSPGSRLFHKYAQISEYAIERENGRISITYTLDLEVVGDQLEVGDGISLSQILELCYKRIHKLDIERRYCKYYAESLTGFKETSACFLFYFGGHRLDYPLDPITISDIVVPGDVTKTIEERDKNYDVPKLVEALHQVCRRCE